jgi:dihydrofolate synthase/folylpolyglutamate synthase
MSGSPRFPRNSSPVDISHLLPPFAPRDDASQWLFRLQRLGIRPGLQAIRELLSELGNPQQRFPSIVVAGTNGKGTAAIYLDALCRSAGLRTGLYTSPHLLDVRERIQVNGRRIGSEQLAELVTAHQRRIDRLGTTFFESLTALTLQHFADEKVDVAIMETGLGGRLDATNVVPKAAVVLTSIGLDHMELLGSTVESIAMEKLGLAEVDVPFYLDELARPIRELALRVLTDRQAIPIELAELGLSSKEPRAGWAHAGLSARGEIQRLQAARMAACYADLARRRGWPPAQLPRAWWGMRVPGRYEIYGSNPPLIVDTAHNAQALERLMRQWRAESSHRRRLLVFGLMRDKQIDTAWRSIVSSSGTILVTAPHWYRSQPPDQLAQRLREEAAQSQADVEILEMGSVRGALEEARRRVRPLHAADDPCSILVTGSHFLVAEALDRLGVDDLGAGPCPSLWDDGRPLRRRERPRERMAVG